MQVLTPKGTTLIMFNTDYTEAIFTRLIGKAHKVKLNKARFTMKKVHYITNLTDEAFIALAQVQREIK